ncbi:hypothetical protein CMV16_00775 [Peribacillus simplex]|nr:hypothetical protein CMV16_00775 [Peribacillus simplex]
MISACSPIIELEPTEKGKADNRSRFERASAVSFFVIIKPYIHHERYEGIKMAVGLYRQYGI